MYSAKELIIQSSSPYYLFSLKISGYISNVGAILATYCCVTNYYKPSNLKKYMFIILKFIICLLYMFIICLLF